MTESHPLQSVIPTYCWHYDPYGERYILFLFICDGYGRYDLADLLSVIKRLWTSHSMSPVEQIDNIRITVNNSTDEMRHLDQWILNLTEPQFCNERIPHQRSYGASQMIWAIFLICCPATTDEGESYLYRCINNDRTVLYRRQDSSTLRHSSAVE